MERKIATIYGKVTAVLNAGGFKEHLQKQLWAEAVQYITVTENLIVRKQQQASSYKKFFGKDSMMVPYLQVFGEMCMITKGNNGQISAKLDNKGEHGMLCGYTDEYPPSTYRIYKPSTKKIVTTRDIRWLHLSYSQWIRKGSNGIIHFKNELIRGQESEALSEVDFVIVWKMKKNDVGKIEKLNSDGLISNKNKFDEQNKISREEQKLNLVRLIDEQNKN